MFSFLACDTVSSNDSIVPVLGFGACVPLSVETLPSTCFLASLACDTASSKSPVAASWSSISSPSKSAFVLLSLKMAFSSNLVLPLDNPRVVIYNP
jgi:hypothetical protein